MPRTRQQINFSPQRKFGNISEPKRLNKKDQAKIAGDMADSLLKMRNVAKQNRLKFLTYFLEMAYLEAFSKSTSLADTAQANSELFSDGSKDNK